MNQGLISSVFVGMMVTLLLGTAVASTGPASDAAHSGPDAPRSMGIPCQSADQCSGGVCLAGFTESPVCTRACAPPFPDCPQLWSCETVSHERVCAPQSLDAAGGCTLARRTRASALPFAVFASLFAVIRARRERAKRTAPVSSPTANPRKGMRA
jgi:hypothetical protein